MREILFRGMPIDDTEAVLGQWVYGFYKTALDHHRIVYFDVKHGWTAIAVDPKSVGQYTELKDKNGIKIYEGDIFLNGQSKRIIETRSGNTHAVTQDRTESILLSFILSGKNNEVIGNISQTPELLEAGE